MAIARKAFVWGLFAAGGTVTAMLFPAVILLFVAISAGLVPAGLEYERLHQALESWPVAICAFGSLVLAAWHAAHRLRILMHDLGLRADGVVASLAYLLAGLFTLLLAVALYPTY